MPFGGESCRHCSGLEERGRTSLEVIPALGSGGLVRVRSGVSFCRAQGQGWAKVEANFKCSSTAKPASRFTTIDKNYFLSKQ